jgi:hypothetical protein
LQLHVLFTFNGNLFSISDAWTYWNVVKKTVVGYEPFIIFFWFLVIMTVGRG